MIACSLTRSYVNGAHLGLCFMHNRPLGIGARYQSGAYVTAGTVAVAVV